MRPLLDDPFILLIPFAIFAGTVLAGLAARKIIFTLLRRWAKRTESHLDVLIIDTLAGPTILWILILGIHLATQNSAIPERFLKHEPPVIKVLWGVSLTIALSKLAGTVVRFYGGALTGAKAVTSLTQKLVQLSVVLVGMVWMLKVVFDISLTPILTTLGVGGLAVALALQDTLSNLFAGFYVSVSGLVRIGDFVKLNTGEEGYVADINWRCTSMRTPANNLVVIPNSKLGQAIFTNYFLPEKRMGLAIVFNVNGDSDIDKVESILKEESVAALEAIPGILRDPLPSVRFKEANGDGSLSFQIGFSVGEFSDQHPSVSELRKRLYKRLRREGIVMATSSPTVVVNPAQVAIKPADADT